MGSRQSIFAVPKLDWKMKKGCECCHQGDSLITGFPEVPLIKGNRKINLPAESGHAFSREIWEALGSKLWETLFNHSITSDEICRINSAGLNHVFVARVRSWFVKVVQFESSANSEAQQMAYLIQNYPKLMEDTTLLFPSGWCRVVAGSVSYDVLVYRYVDGKNVRDLVFAYEQLKDQELEKKLWPSMVSLFRSTAKILRRYQTSHGRKHGDAKADNFMVTVDGSILLCDHGVNVLARCDKSEFLRSLLTSDPQLKMEFSSAFEENLGEIVDSSAEIRELLCQLCPTEGWGSDAASAQNDVRRAPTPNAKSTGCAP